MSGRDFRESGQMGDQNKTEVRKSEVTAKVGRVGLEFTLSLVESIVSVDENGRHGFQRFHTFEKASASSSQTRYAAANIGIHAINDMHIFLL